MKSHHSFPPRSSPCLYYVFHIHFGIKQWDSRCCTGFSVLTLNSNHSVMTWPTSPAADDLLPVPLLCSAMLLLGSMIQSVMEEKQSRSIHRLWNTHSSRCCQSAGGGSAIPVVHSERDPPSDWFTYSTTRALSELHAAQSVLINMPERSTICFVFK